MDVVIFHALGGEEGKRGGGGREYRRREGGEKGCMKVHEGEEGKEAKEKRGGGERNSRGPASVWRH